MDKINRILVLVLAGLVLVVLFVIARQRQPVNTIGSPQNPALSSPASSYESKTNSEGSVAVEVTPLVLKAGEPPKFQTYFNTHSVDLSFNVEDIVSLTDDKGNIIGSPHWTGSSPGGHHRSGELDFGDALNQDAKQVTLTLKNIAGVPSRIFVWNLL